MNIPFTARRIYTRPGKSDSLSGDFRCLHCGALVSAGAVVSGVRNRNHCPYCLSSRHLDHFEAGDRLSACKARMRPVGLTFKRTAKKYVGHGHGEVMIVHVCEDCDKVSINRIAADDDNERLLSLLEKPIELTPATRNRLAQDGITPLSMADADLVRQCLSGIPA